MTKMDPTASPTIAFTDAQYVEPPEALGQSIASSLDINPGATHLVVGGVGSGKSSELLRVEQCLSTVEDIICFRLDVLAEHQLSKMQAGVLVGLAAAHVAKCVETDLGEGASEDVKQAVRGTKGVVNGRWADRWSEDRNDYQPDDSVWVEGLIKKPSDSDTVNHLAALLGRLTGAAGKRFVILFDGLDRERDIARFTKSVAQDVRALRRCGVGCVVVGPQELRLSEHKQIIEVFSRFHLHGAAAYVSQEGRTFLETVLRQRDPQCIIPAELREKLATWSGGLVRDMLAIAHAAGEAAYSAGRDEITKEDVDQAADTFGRNLLLSATPEMGDRLKELVPPKVGSFVPKAKPKSEPAFVLTSEGDIEMLIRRLIIELPGVPVRYIPHPTLVPLVRSMGRHL